MGRNRFTPRFFAITVVFVSCLVAANLVASKLISVFSFVLPAAVVVFPVTYIFGDILTEVYGYRMARLVIWTGFTTNLIVVAVIWVAQILPPAPIWHHQSAFVTILGQTPRILAASFLAYLVGEFLNSIVLSKMKLMTKGRYLWTRTIGSTIVGQAADSSIFITVAFIGTIPSHALLLLVLTQWLFKVSYEVLVTPVTYLIVGSLKRREQIDTFDYDTNLNPLRVFDT